MIRRIPILFLLTVIIAVIMLFLLTDTRIFVDDEARVIVTVEVTRPVPVFVTSVPEPDIPRDLWRCLQNPTLAQVAPDIPLDYQNFIIMNFYIEPQGQGQVNHYGVYNKARPSEGVVEIQVVWGLEEGRQVVSQCLGIPKAWANYPPDATPFPLNTPAPVPGEGVGEPES